MVQAAPKTKTTESFHSYPINIQKLIHHLQSGKNFTPIQIKEIIAEANISSEDLFPWADFNHPVADSYGRKLVFNGGHFEVMVMSWLPGDFSAIHDHGSTQWGAVQCFGVAEHYIYSFKDGILKTEKPAHYTPYQIHTVDHDLIHQMGNSGNDPFLSLHVYGCAESTENITGNARIFDLLEECIQYTDGGVFFCLPQSQINYRVPGIKGDMETTLRYHRLMRDRVRRILQSKDNFS